MAKNIMSKKIFLQNSFFVVHFYADISGMNKYCMCYLVQLSIVHLCTIQIAVLDTLCSPRESKCDNNVNNTH